MAEQEDKYNRMNSIIRQFSLLLGFMLSFVGFAAIYLDIIYERIGRFDIWAMLFLYGVLFFISLFGINIIFQTLSRSTIELQKYYRSLLEKTSNGLVNLIFIGLFLTALVFMLIILIQPDLVFHQSDEKIRFNAQVLVSVCLGGFLGGFVRETYSRFLLSKDELANVILNNFWTIIFSLLGSVLLSIIFFLLLRAGILKSESVDSFNLYGVTGISTITGYLSDRVISRFSVLYETLFESNESKINKVDKKDKTDDNNALPPTAAKA